MLIVSTTNRALACQDLEEPNWVDYRPGFTPEPALFALPIAQKGSETRYRVFPAGTRLDLFSRGDECHFSVWEVDQEPLGDINGYFFRELRSPDLLTRLKASESEFASA